ncbi:MAG: helix-turn-helix transcriptional regulator [Bacteroidaceae bacterium]|nr:helix-turn-helix transcriptional regulator [Bacteroidaceae bacterium]
MKERITKIMQKEEMTAAQFAEKIGLSPSSLSHILNGRNNPSLDVVMKIHKACNYVNLPWLIYGEGEMEWKAEAPKQEETGISGMALFDESAFFTSEGTEERENRKEMAPKTPIYAPKEIVREEIKYIEKPARKITEIRIFFDNGTYETFRPDK